ncbi:hypothetical protein PCASD_23114 [Puccinia coronata f. sp. avenae]|uniref:Uncharacterized protein n=1 Tax=Puccinia coronata f. sp. avenae TaxID=200324 RepID=A0A2N5S5W7_9BASI|nr:hypothetical protein PCASD_23114 [Puccinia coronata f. sp. avenae]
MMYHPFTSLMGEEGSAPSSKPVCNALRKILGLDSPSSHPSAGLGVCVCYFSRASRQPRVDLGEPGDIAEPGVV